MYLRKESKAATRKSIPKHREKKKRMLVTKAENVCKELSSQCKASKQNET